MVHGLAGKGNLAFEKIVSEMRGPGLTGVYWVGSGLRSNQPSEFGYFGKVEILYLHRRNHHVKRCFPAGANRWAHLLDI